MALGAEDAYGVILSLFSVVSRASFFLALGHILCLKGIEYLKDISASSERFDKVGGIFSGAIHMSLIFALELDSKGLDSLEEFFLKVLSIVFVAAERVGNVNVGAADIFVVCVANYRLNVCGY